MGPAKVLTSTAMLLRIGPITACVLVIVLLLSAGCRDSAVQDDRTLVRFSFWGNFRDFALWKEMQKGFEAANPDVRLKLEYVTGNYHQKLPLRLPEPMWLGDPAWMKPAIIIIMYLWGAGMLIFLRACRGCRSRCTWLPSWTGRGVSASSGT